MYELVQPERSIHVRPQQSEEQLALPDNDRVLDAILHGAAEALVQQELRGQARQAAQPAAAPSNRPPRTRLPSTFSTRAVAMPDLDISFPGETPEQPMSLAELEPSYADRLDNIAVKTNEIFGQIVQDLFGDDNLLPRLRRLFWLEATRAERDFNNHLVKPMLRQHDRKLHDEELRKAMEIDLESVSDIEELMRTWEGLHRLESSLAG